MSERPPADPPRSAPHSEPPVAAQLPRAIRTMYRRLRRLAGRAARSLGVHSTLTAARSRVREQLRLRTAARAFDGITVIIPTHRPHVYLDEAIRSVLRQDLPARLVKVIVSVNGPDVEHADNLRRRYRWTRRLRVLHTPRGGLSAGRNFALQHVRTDLFTYLDDDDYFTKGYLRGLLLAMTPDAEMACGRLVDERDGRRDPDTYINRAIQALDTDASVADYVRGASLLTSACAKLYRTTFARSSYRPFDEAAAHTEDVRFWAHNIDKLTGPLALVSARSGEAYVRRVTDGSMSRPSEEQAYQFWVTDRLAILHELEDLIFQQDLSLAGKRFVMVKLEAQAGHLRTYFEQLTGLQRDRARDEILSAGVELLNTSFLAQRRGIAFCHNFSPARDTSAYVATKRLSQVSDLFGESISWRVVSANMTRLRGRDESFSTFYARRLYDQLIQIPGRVYFNPQSQHEWATRAAGAVVDESAEVVYSRSMFAGSHEAAYRYKQRHPEATWYAEFSDPISLDTSGSERPVPNGYTGPDEWLNDYWRTVENWVYESADCIIFTNANQREVMLERATPALLGRARARARVLAHPTVGPRWSSLIPADYPMGHDINIGYFGSFYANRAADRILALLADPRVHLHLFVANPDDVASNHRHERLHINRAVDHLRFLSIGRSMDYLVLSDVEYPGATNPYLPSKFADYLATGTTILAFTDANSVLSQFQSEQLIVLREAGHAELSRVFDESLT